MIQHVRILTVLTAALFLFACDPQTPPLSPEEAKQIAKEAYIYGFPLVMNYKTLYAYALENRSPEYKGDLNELSCDARVYTPEDKAVVTPNSDTPYCMFWCNISSEPVVISVPEIEAGRYYSFQLIDLYTHNFNYIGTLTTGNHTGKYLIAPAGWNGETPAGINETIYCETDLFFTVVRTQLMNEDDLENVKNIQNQYQVQTLGEYLGGGSGASASIETYPAWVEGEQFNIEAFKYLNFMLHYIKPLEHEKALLEQFAKISIGGEAIFDTTQFTPETLQAIKDGVQEGFADIMAFIKEHGDDPLGSAKSFGTREFLTRSAREHYNLDNPYMIRSAAAQMGLYGNSGFEAAYPTYLFDADGERLNGSENNYTITFKADEFPPVKAFWSITMYDGQTQLMIHNPIDRYLVNASMLDDFVMGDDGSLTFYIQQTSPGAALEANWLPAPNGPFYCVMRLYGPEDAVLSGKWVNPPMVKTAQ